MTKPAGENWQSIGSIAADVVAKLEATQRETFKRECERDGVKKPEVSDVSRS